MIPLRMTRNHAYAWTVEFYERGAKEPPMILSQALRAALTDGRVPGF